MVRHPATLQSRHGEISFLIRNFSSSGMFLETVNGRALSEHKDASKIQQGEEIFVRIKFKGKPILSLAASVDRIEELGVGIVFFKTQLQLEQDLKQLAKQQRNAGADAAPIKTAELGSVLKELGEIAMRFVKRHDKEFIEVSNDALFELAGKAGSAVQGPLFDAMGILRKHGENIRKSYIAGVQSHLETFARIDLFEGLDTEHSSGKELSLVDERELDNWLALSEIVNSAESRSHRELYLLEQRLALVLDEKVEPANNPMSAAALCNHLYVAVIDCDFEHKPLQVIWRSFNETTIVALPELYKQWSRAMIDAGILPKLSFKFGGGSKVTAAAGAQVHETPEALEEADVTPGAAPLEHPNSAAGLPAVAPAAAGQPLTSSEKRTHARGAVIIDLSKILRARQSASAGGSIQTGRGGRPTKPFDLNELNQALADLQGAGQAHQQPLSSRIFEALQNRHGAEDSRQLNDNHSRAIYLAQELLHAINSDEVLEPQAKDWVQRLEVPLVKMLLDDDSILNDPQHPARHLINQLGQAQAGFSDPKSDRDLKVVKSIESIVDGLSQAQAPYRSAFSDAAKEITGLLKRQQRLRAIQIKRVLEACDGQQKLSTAKILVQQELDRRFADEEVPRVIVDLLKLGLHNQLDLAAIRTGIEGDDFFESIGLIDDLRARLSPGYKSKSRDRQNSESLIERIDEKLLQANTSTADRNRLRKLLESVLPGLANGAGQHTAELIPFPVPTKPPGTPEPETDLDQDDALWLGRAKLMQIGNWMLYPTADGKTKPIKLAWVSKEHDRYVFVNRQGHKELEITPTELSKQLKNKTVDIIDQPDEPLMDRSAQGMMQHMHEQIAHQATHDQLTDVLNRKEFERQLRLKLGESKLMQTSHVAMQIDIDQFRVINTSSGHDAGDQLLRDVAKVLTQNLPEDGVVARLGGDEFAVLLPRCELAPGHEAAETFRQSIRNHRTPWKRRKLKSTASIGLVSIDRDCESVSQTLNQLESACAAAHDAGGDRVKSYQVDDEEMSRRDRALGWVKALENGLDQGRLELYGHRIISLNQNHHKEHYEVLSRLRGEDGEFISPEDFVPAAEAYGRIHLLDEWVFKTAFEALASSPRADEIERLYLNVSGKTFSQPRFVQYIKDLLDDTGIHASKICFEITETAAISNLSRCIDCLRELKVIGCRFSLDDFGTGLSSFSYLKNLPVDYLKIDGSFVKEIVHSTADYWLVKTINEVGHFLGKKTVAEYVENEEILKRLQEIGLDYAQGFGIEKPKPLNEILDLEQNT